VSYMETRTGNYFYLYGLLGILSLLSITSCGSSQASTKKTSGLKKRVLISNTLGNAFIDQAGILRPGTGAVDIMDASADRFVSQSNPLSDLFPALHINATGAAGMATAGGITAVINASGSTLTLIDNAKEEAAHEVVFVERVEDVAISTDGKTAYAAVRNTGQVAIVNTADATVTFVSVPSPRRLVLSPNGSRLLVFADDPQTLPPPRTNAFCVIDTAAKTATSISLPGQDQPVFGVFNTSETRAFILNCGAECFGSTASVMLIDFSGAPTIVSSVPVAAATTGMLNGTTLYIAGTPVGGSMGTFQSVNTASMTASTAVSITDGHHEKIAFANNRIYVGALACTPVNNNVTGKIRGCLTIFNTTSGTALLPEVSRLRAGFGVTGLRPIAGRNVVYVCEGGELDIYDTATDLITNDKIDVVGQAADAVQIDP
jgi:DNA-binding beta-propeller fold protein YncE